MIDHMSISPSDIESAQLFHDAALEPLGISTVTEVKPEQSGGYHGIGSGTGGKPFFWLSNDSRRVISNASGGTGIHIAFEAESRAAVDAFFAAAFSEGLPDAALVTRGPACHTAP
ncbi:VOC family protein [Methylorubrum thiocyanatum]